jgi:PTH1 family peptidyl-tRNA hydrolase
MKLIIGIGNPDPEYADTRHNVGWQFLEWLRKKHKGESFANNKKLEAEVSRTDVDGIKTQLIRPQTYVNRSGSAAAKAKKWAKAKNEDIVVIQDDLDVPFGKCKMSFEKNSGGHRGIESIMSSLRSKKFYRIRIGLGIRSLDKAREQTSKRRDEFVKDFVLKKFTPAQREQLKQIFKDCELRLMNALKAKN